MLENREMAVAAERIARRLCLSGLHGLDFMLDEDGRAHLIEINPRFGGAASLGFAAGAPTPEFAVRVALGQRVVPQIGAFTEDLVMLRYTEDRFVAGSTLDAMGTL